MIWFGWEKGFSEKEILEHLKVFEGFFTYFSGFNQNRENYYETKAPFIGLSDYPGSVYRKDLTSFFSTLKLQGHTLVHTWYHGTIDTVAQKDEFGEGNEVGDWYDDSKSPLLPTTSGRISGLPMPPLSR